MISMVLYFLYALLGGALLVFLLSYYLGRYCYCLKEGDKISMLNNDQNLQLLKRLPHEDTFSFLVLGDIQSNFRNLGKTLFKSHEKKYSFAVQTGDLVSHADTGHYALTLNEIKKSRLHVPLFVVPGNHDVKRNPEIFEKYFGSKRFFFIWSNCLFIFFDNSAGPPYTQQFQWLEGVLREHNNRARWTFIFMHREPIEWGRSKPHPAMDDYTPFFNLQNIFRINYVFTGHVHGYRKLKLNGTTYISNGALNRIKGITVTPSYATVVKVAPEQISDHKITITPSLITIMEGKILDGMVAHLYPLLARVFIH